MYDNAEELREQQAVVLDDHDHMSNSSEDRQTIITRSKTSSQDDWVLLAVAIDRITFLIYCLIFTIFATVYAVWFSTHQCYSSHTLRRRLWTWKHWTWFLVLPVLLMLVVTLCQINLPRRKLRSLQYYTSAALTVTVYFSTYHADAAALLWVLRCAINRPLRAVAKSRQTRHNLDLTNLIILPVRRP